MLDGIIVRAEAFRLDGLSALLALLVRELDAVLPRAHVLLVELDRRLRLALQNLEELGDISREATTAARRRERHRLRHRAGGRRAGGLQPLAATTGVA